MGSNYGTIEKQIGDIIKFIIFAKPELLPTRVPYQLFSDIKKSNYVDGLHKPSESYANRNFYQITRRKFLNDLKASQRQQYYLTQEEQHKARVQSEIRWKTLELRQKKIRDKLNDKKQRVLKSIRSSNKNHNDSSIKNQMKLSKAERDAIEKAVKIELQEWIDENELLDGLNDESDDDDDDIDNDANKNKNKNTNKNKNKNNHDGFSHPFIKMSKQDAMKSGLMTDPKRITYEINSQMIKSPKHEDDPLSFFYDLERIDKDMMKKYKFDDDDMKHQGDTCERRRKRKEHLVLSKIYFNCKWQPADKWVRDLAYEIFSVFKRTLWINCVFFATKKQWLAAYMNFGFRVHSRTIFPLLTIDKFNIKDQNGMWKYINITNYIIFY